LNDKLKLLRERQNDAIKEREQLVYKTLVTISNVDMSNYEDFL